MVKEKKLQILLIFYHKNLFALEMLINVKVV
jgi:hypothetical protein